MSKLLTFLLAMLDSPFRSPDSAGLIMRIYQTTPMFRSNALPYFANANDFFFHFSAGKNMIVQGGDTVKQQTACIL